MKHFAAFHEFRDQTRNLRGAIQAGEQLQQLFPLRPVLSQSILQRHVPHGSPFVPRGVGRKKGKWVFVILILHQVEEDAFRNPEVLAALRKIQRHGPGIRSHFPRKNLVQAVALPLQPLFRDMLRTQSKGHGTEQRLNILLRQRGTRVLTQKLQVGQVRQALEKRIAQQCQKRSRRTCCLRPALKSHRVQRREAVLLKAGQQFTVRIVQHLRVRNGYKAICCKRELHRLRVLHRICHLSPPPHRMRPCRRSCLVPL